MLRLRFELLGRQQQYSALLRLHLLSYAGARGRVPERHRSSASVLADLPGKVCNYLLPGGQVLVPAGAARGKRSEHVGTCLHYAGVQMHA